MKVKGLVEYVFLAFNSRNKQHMNMGDSRAAQKHGDIFAFEGMFYLPGDDVAGSHEWSGKVVTGFYVSKPLDVFLQNDKAVPAGDRVKV